MPFSTTTRHTTRCSTCHLHCRICNRMEPMPIHHERLCAELDEPLERMTSANTRCRSHCSPSKRHIFFFHICSLVFPAVVAMVEPGVVSRGVTTVGMNSSDLFWVLNFVAFPLRFLGFAGTGSPQSNQTITTTSRPRTSSGGGSARISLNSG